MSDVLSSLLPLELRSDDGSEVDIVGDVVGWVFGGAVGGLVFVGGMVMHSQMGQSFPSLTNPRGQNIPQTGGHCDGLVGALVGEGSVVGSVVVVVANVLNEGSSVTGTVMVGIPDGIGVGSEVVGDGLGIGVSAELVGDRLGGPQNVSSAAFPAEQQLASAVSKNWRIIGLVQYPVRASGLLWATVSPYWAVRQDVTSQSPPMLLHCSLFISGVLPSACGLHVSSGWEDGAPPSSSPYLYPAWVHAPIVE